MKKQNETINLELAEVIEWCREDFYSLIQDAFAHQFSVEKPLEECVYPKLQMAKLNGRMLFLGECFNSTFPSVYDFAEEYAEHWITKNDGTKEEWLEWFDKAFFFDYETRLDRK